MYIHVLIENSSSDFMQVNGLYFSNVIKSTVEVYSGHDLLLLQ